MACNEEETWDWRWRGKAKMQETFSWTIETNTINTQQALAPRTFKLPHLPDFEFSFRVIKSDEPDCRENKIHIEVVKTPSKALYSELSIYLMSKHVCIHQFVHRWHEWAEKSCENRDVAIGESDVISFTCEISWVSETSSRLDHTPSHLDDDYRWWLCNPLFSDVKIIIGNEELVAHRYILTMFSSGFMSMFSSDEGLRCVVINDITFGVMKNVLTFIYSGWDKPLDDSDMALQMLFVAEKYTIEKLKARCEDKLQQQLTISNVLKFLDSSVRNNAAKLKAECLKFMLDNRHAMMGNASDEQTQIVLGYIQHLSTSN